jgi:hypothetical protein
LFRYKVSSSLDVTCFGRQLLMFRRILLLPLSDHKFEDFFRCHFNLPNPSGRTRPKRLKKWVPEDHSGGKARNARKADNLTAISEPIV